MTRARKVHCATTLRPIGIALLLLLGVGCNSNASRMLPHSLDGVWTTDDPRFQERFLELSPSFVIIVTGQDDPASVQFIDKVVTEPLVDGSAFTVYSTDYSQGAHYHVTLEFSPANGGELHVRNQGQVWRRR